MSGGGGRGGRDERRCATRQRKQRAQRQLSGQLTSLAASLIGLVEEGADEFLKGGGGPVEESFQTEMANQAAPSASTQPHRPGSIRRAEDGHNFLPQSESCVRLDALYHEQNTKIFV